MPLPRISPTFTSTTFPLPLALGICGISNSPTPTRAPASVIASLSVPRLPLAGLCLHSPGRLSPDLPSAGPILLNACRAPRPLAPQRRHNWGADQVQPLPLHPTSLLQVPESARARQRPQECSHPQQPEKTPPQIGKEVTAYKVLGLSPSSSLSVQIPSQLGASASSPRKRG